MIILLRGILVHYLIMPMETKITNAITVLLNFNINLLFTKHLKFVSSTLQLEFTIPFDVRHSVLIESTWICE